MTCLLVILATMMMINMSCIEGASASHFEQHSIVNKKYKSIQLLSSKTKQQFLASRTRRKSSTPNLLLVFMFASSSSLVDLVDGQGSLDFHVDPLTMQNHACQVGHSCLHPRMQLTRETHPHIFPGVRVPSHTHVLRISPLSFLGSALQAQSSSLSATKLSPVSFITNGNNDEESRGGRRPLEEVLPRQLAQEKMTGIMMTSPSPSGPSSPNYFPPSTSSTVPGILAQHSFKKEEEEPQGRRLSSPFESRSQEPPATSSVVVRMSRQASYHHLPTLFTASYPTSNGHHYSPEGTSTSFPSNYDSQPQISYLNPPSTFSPNIMVMRNMPTNLYQQNANNMMTTMAMPSSGLQSVSMLPVPPPTPPSVTTMTSQVPMSMMEKTCNCMCDDTMPTQPPKTPVMSTLQVIGVPMMMSTQQPTQMMPVASTTTLPVNNPPACNNNHPTMNTGFDNNNKTPMTMVPPVPLAMTPPMNSNNNNNQYRPENTPSQRPMNNQQQQSMDSNSFHTNEGLQSYSSFDSNDNNNNFYGRSHHEDNSESEGMKSRRQSPSTEKSSSRSSSHHESDSSRRNHLNSHNHHRDDDQHESEKESEMEDSFPEARSPSRSSKKMTTSSKTHHPSRHNHYKKKYKKTATDRLRFNHDSHSDLNRDFVEDSSGGGDVLHKNKNDQEDPEEVIPGRTSSKSPEVTDGHYSLSGVTPGGHPRQQLAGHHDWTSSFSPQPGLHLAVPLDFHDILSPFPARSFLASQTASLEGSKSSPVSGRAGRRRNRKTSLEEDSLEELFDANFSREEDDDDNNNSPDGHGNVIEDESTEEDFEESHSKMLGILASEGLSRKDEGSRRSLSKTESPYSASSFLQNNNDSRTAAVKSISTSTSKRRLLEELADLERQLRQQEDKQNKQSRRGSKDSRFERTRVRASSSSSLVSHPRIGRTLLHELLNPFA